MPSMDLQSEAFLQLLGDALRAGPGSPEWRQAVTTLKENGDAPQADEYQILIAARERLESGRPYRAVRAGPAFTRKLMDQIDAYRPDGGRWKSISTWVAILAGVVLIGVVITVSRLSSSDSPIENGPQQLGQTYFVKPLLTADFADPLSPPWQAVGDIPLTPSRLGLRLQTTEGRSDDYRGGGIYASTPLPPHQPFSLEAHIRGRGLSDDLIPQVFVTDTPDFSSDLGTSPHELTWLIKARRFTVALPDGRFEAGTGAEIKDLRQPLTVRIILNDRFALVECGGERLWAGEHQLDPDKPRYVGLRFLRRGAGGQDHLAFESLKVLLPQDPQ